MKSRGKLDEATFRILFENNFRNLVIFAHGYVKDLEAAREIVQDSFVNLWIKRESIDLSKPVATYLSTSVRNKCLNYLRDNKKFSRELLTLENPLEAIAAGNTDKLVEQEMQQRIDSAIHELPEKCREVFLLSRHENLRYQQIADKLSISVKTVETQMSKALGHLRNRLAEYLSVSILVSFSFLTTLHQGIVLFMCII